MSHVQTTEADELALKASIQPVDIDYASIRATKKQATVFGAPKRKLHRRRLLKNAIVILRLYRTPGRVLRILNSIRKRRNAIAGGKNVYKVVSIGQRHFWRINIPAWESPLFDAFLSSELHRLEPHHQKSHRLTLTYLAITKKCPLKCEHCFEWDNLNQKEKISSANIHTMIENLQSIGTTNIAFTGGEPMLRVQEITHAVQKYNDRSAFWIITSGFNFTEENAANLKAAGLTGVVVSIDHHDPHQEPQPVGHYAMRNVMLKPDQLNLLEEVFLSYNQEESYRDFPIIVYHGYYQRRVGCMASGNRMVYVDTNGDFMKCPFCHEKSGSLLDENFETTINEMNMESCSSFGSFG